MCTGGIVGSVIGGTVRFFGALLSSPLVTPGFFNGRKYSKTIKKYKSLYNTTYIHINKYLWLYLCFYWWRTTVSEDRIKSSSVQQPVRLLSPFTLSQRERHSGQPNIFVISSRGKKYYRLFTFIWISPLSSSSNDPAWKRMSAVDWDTWIFKAVCDIHIYF